MHDERLGVHVCFRLVPPAMTNQGPSVLAIVYTVVRQGEKSGAKYIDIDGADQPVPFPRECNESAEKSECRNVLNMRQTTAKKA